MHFENDRHRKDFYIFRLVFIIAFINSFIHFFNLSAAHSKNTKKCFFINSYHKGYDWSDELQSETEKGLKDHCEFSVFYLDNKRVPDIKRNLEQGRAAWALINRLKPNVVIAADDPASEYVIKPFLKNAKIPVVFCGVNWSTKNYNYPYTNTTGMIEVTPIFKLMDKIKEYLPNVKSGVFLAGDASGEKENADRFSQAATANKVYLKSTLVKSMDEWVAKIEQVQTDETDFVIIANNAGIKDWSINRAESAIKKNKKLTATNHTYMAPLAMVSVVKLASEQGTFAAGAAKKIMAGESPNSIPIVTNTINKESINLDRLRAAEIVR